MSQFALINNIAAMNECTQGELGKAAGLDSTTLTRTLATPVSLGWIERVQSEKDRRQWRLKLTPVGMARLRSALPQWVAAQQRVRTIFGDENWNQLQSLLQHLNGALHTDTPSPLHHHEGDN